MHKFILFIPFIFFVADRFLNTFGRAEPKGEIKYLWLTRIVVVGYFLSIIIAVSDFILQPGAMNLELAVLGFIVTAAGIFLRKSAIKALGSNWTIHTKKIAGIMFTKNGPYRYMHHPYYLAVILELGGIGLYFNSGLSIIFTLCLQLPLLILRSWLEDKINRDSDRF